MLRGGSGAPPCYPVGSARRDWTLSSSLPGGDPSPEPYDAIQPLPTEPHARSQVLSHYIILNNEILKSNASIFPRSKGYITQYTPEGVYGLIVNENNEVNISLMVVKMI